MTTDAELGYMKGITSIEFRRNFAVGSRLVAAWSRVQPRIACVLECAEFRILWGSFI